MRIFIAFLIRLNATYLQTEVANDKFVRTAENGNKIYEMHNHFDQTVKFMIELNLKEYTISMVKSTTVNN
jgi:hypothetical protein